jgi:SAM-dependent methyltransferase
MTPITRCRSCGSADLHPVCSLGKQPLANALPTDPTAPQARYPLDVVFCAGCALAQLTVSVDPVEMFRDYAYFSAFSPTVGREAAALVKQLLSSLPLDATTLVMEIASNDGYLLRHYVAAGVPVLGIDPAENIKPAAEAAGVPTRTEFFDLALAQQLRAEGVRPAVLHANNVLAHVPDINSFVAGIATVLADDGIAVVETPYLRDLVDHLEYDTIYHEHVYYYSATAVARLFARHDLELVDVARIPIHGGSLRLFARHAGRARPDRSVQELLAAEQRGGLDTPAYYQRFGERVDELRGAQARFVHDAVAAGRRVAGYGAAAKATVALNAMGDAATLLEFVADQSPHKQGRHIPGVGLPIVEPDALCRLQPDFTVIFAWNFAEEIQAAFTDYQRQGGRFVVPVPSVRVLDPPD